MMGSPRLFRFAVCVIIVIVLGAAWLLWVLSDYDTGISSPSEHAELPDSEVEPGETPRDTGDREWQPPSEFDGAEPSDHPESQASSQEAAPEGSEESAAADEPAPAIVRGRVVDSDARPVEAAKVMPVAVDSSSDEPLQNVRMWRARVQDAEAPVSVTDPSGHFELRVEPEQLLRVVAQGPVPFAEAISADAVILRPGEEADIGELIVERGGVIEGRVTDHLGLPVEGALVHPEVRYTGSGSRRYDSSGRLISAEPFLLDPRNATTDEDGRYRIVGLPSAPLVLTVEAQGYMHAQRDDIDSTLGEEIRDVDFTVHPAVDLLITVLDQHERFISEAHIAARHGAIVRGDPFAEVRTNERGRATLEELVEEPLILDVRAEGFATARVPHRIRPDDESTHQVTIRLHAAALITGRLVDTETGDGLAVPTMIAHNALDDRSRAGRFTARMGPSMPLPLEPDGSFAVRDLKPGIISLSFRPEGYVWHEEQLELTDGGAELGEIRISPGWTVDVEVRDGEEPVETDVRLHHRYLPLWRKDTDSEGMVRFTGASADAFRLSARYDGSFVRRNVEIPSDHPRQEPYHVVIDVAQTAEVRERDPEPQGTQTLTLVLQHHDGTPFSNRAVQLGSMTYIGAGRDDVEFRTLINRQTDALGRIELEESPRDRSPSAIRVTLQGKVVHLSIPRYAGAAEQLRPDTMEFDLPDVLNAGSLRMTVRDRQSGEPLGPAEVRLRALGRVRFVEYVEVAREGTVLDELWPGTYQVRMESPEFGAVQAEVEVVGGETAEVVLETAKAAELHVVVRSSDPNASATASVRATDEETGRGHTGRGAVGTVITVDGLLAGVTYRVRCRLPGHEERIIEAVAEPTTESPIEVMLQPSQ